MKQCTLSPASHKHLRSAAVLTEEWSSILKSLGVGQPDPSDTSCKPTECTPCSKQLAQANIAVRLAVSWTQVNWPHCGQWCAVQCQPCTIKWHCSIDNCAQSSSNAPDPSDNCALSDSLPDSCTMWQSSDSGPDHRTQWYWVLWSLDSTGPISHVRPGGTWSKYHKALANIPRISSLHPQSWILCIKVEIFRGKFSHLKLWTWHNRSFLALKDFKIHGHCN